MLLVDDRVALVALSGRRFYSWGDRVPTITWLFHYRLLQALMFSNIEGQLSRGANAELIHNAQQPPPELLAVRDPRHHTAEIVTTANDAKLSIAAAEFLTVAISNNAEIHIAERNISTNWTNALEGTNVVIEPYSADQLALARHGLPHTPQRDLPGLA